MKSSGEFDVVLCRAEEPGNVGAVCRAMMSMGFSSLVLVACPEYPVVPVKTFALRAFGIYESSRRAPFLEQALAGYSLVAGFTRRTGRLRVREPMDVGGFASEALHRQGRIALVFGNERDGLSAEELALCDIAVRIPTSEAFPSLNLAQAVQIACWEIFRHREDRGDTALRNDGKPNRGEAVSRAYIEKTVGALADDLARAGFFKIAGRPELVRFLRSLLARAAPQAWELEYFRTILSKAAALPGLKKSEALTPDPGGARVGVDAPVGAAPEGDG